MVVLAQVPAMRSVRGPDKALPMTSSRYVVGRMSSPLAAKCCTTESGAEATNTPAHSSLPIASTTIMRHSNTAVHMNDHDSLAIQREIMFTLAMPGNDSAALKPQCNFTIDYSSSEASLEIYMQHKALVSVGPSKAAATNGNHGQLPTVRTRPLQQHNHDQPPTKLMSNLRLFVSLTPSSTQNVSVPVTSTWTSTRVNISKANFSSEAAIALVGIDRSAHSHNLEGPLSRSTSDETPQVSRTRLSLISSVTIVASESTLRPGINQSASSRATEQEALVRKAETKNPRIESVSLAISPYCPAPDPTASACMISEPLLPKTNNEIALKQFQDLLDMRGPCDSSALDCQHPKDPLEPRRYQEATMSREDHDASRSRQAPNVTVLQGASNAMTLTISCEATTYQHTRKGMELQDASDAIQTISRQLGIDEERLSASRTLATTNSQYLATTPSTKNPSRSAALESNCATAAPDICEDPTQAIQPLVVTQSTTGSISRSTAMQEPSCEWPVIQQLQTAAVIRSAQKELRIR
jgi:hypothetical protein